MSGKLLHICVIALAVLTAAGCGADSGTTHAAAPFQSLPKNHSGRDSYPPGSTPDGATELELEVFAMVNAERLKAGLDELVWCDGLYTLARAHSCDMCDRGFFSHFNPEGEDPTTRGREGRAGNHTFISIVPDPYLGIAENIAEGYSCAQTVMTAWMNSPGHREALLNGDYTHIGVGICTECGRHWTICLARNVSLPSE